MYEYTNFDDAYYWHGKSFTIHKPSDIIKLIGLIIIQYHPLMNSVVNLFSHAHRDT